MSTSFESLPPGRWVLTSLLCMAALACLSLGGWCAWRGHVTGVGLGGLGAALAAWSFLVRPGPEWVRVNEHGVSHAHAGQLRTVPWRLVHSVSREALLQPDGTPVLWYATVRLSDGEVFRVSEEWSAADAVLGSLVLRRFEPAARFDVTTGTLRQEPS